MPIILAIDLNKAEKTIEAFETKSKIKFQWIDEYINIIISNIN